MKLDRHGVDPMEIAFRRAEFRDPASEARFLAHHMPTIQRELRFSVLVAAFFYLSFTFSDIAGLGLGPQAALLFVARLVVVIAALGGVLITARHPASVTTAHAVASIVEIVAMATFLYISAVRANELAWHATGLAIMLFVIYTHIPNRLMYAVAICVASSIGFAGVALVYAQLDQREMVTLVMLLFLANSFGMLEARRYQQVWREQFRSQDVLREQSVRDHLTGCYNRRHLHQNLLQNEIERSRRYQLCLTVVLCDIDHFKSINDTHGHVAGDAVLTQFAKVLLRETRQGIDSVVRYGGEEFLIVLPETDLASATLIAERLRSAFASVPIEHDGKSIAATASFGVASLDYSRAPPALTEYEVIAHADELMYASKHAGRNRVSLRQIA